MSIEPMSREEYDKRKGDSKTDGSLTLGKINSALTKAIENNDPNAEIKFIVAPNWRRILNRPLTLWERIKWWIWR